MSSEIGSSKTLELDQVYLLHIQAKPLEFGRFLKKLQDNEKDENGEPLSQRNMAKYLRNIGMRITQSEISRYLSVLDLPDKYIKMLEGGNLAFISAYMLSRMTSEDREEVYNVAYNEALESLEEEDSDAEPVVKIYRRHVQRVKRKNMASDDIFKNLLKQDDFDQPYESVPDEHKVEVTEETIRKIHENITLELGDLLISNTDLSNILGMLKMRASEHPDQEKEIKGKIRPTDFNMFITQSEPVQKVIHSVSKIVRKALDEEGYRVA